MKTYIVDSFTDRPFTGNPAGVCLVEGSLDESQMLLVAQELGLSETAFIQEFDSSNNWSIRFFSPIREIPLCGHATLASAAVLFESLDTSAVNFVNIDGLILTATYADGNITLEFPIYETQEASVQPELLEALGLSSVENVVYNKESNILLLEITDAMILSALAPNYHAVHESHTSINGVLVTAPSTGDRSDFHSRYFWPWSGTDEDPVTRGTHTFLAKYWSSRLGKTHLRSFESSNGTGFMEVDVEGESLPFTSQAQIALSGELRL